MQLCYWLLNHLPISVQYLCACLIWRLTNQFSDIMGTVWQSDHWIHKIQKFVVCVSQEEIRSTSYHCCVKWASVLYMTQRGRAVYVGVKSEVHPCTGTKALCRPYGLYGVYTITPFHLVCPDAFRLVGDSFSGNGCGSSNHV